MLRHAETSPIRPDLTTITGNNQESTPTYQQLKRDLALAQRALAKQDELIQLLRSKDDTSALKQKIHSLTTQLEIALEERNVLEGSINNPNFRAAELVVLAHVNLDIVRKKRTTPEGEPVKAPTPTSLNAANKALKTNTNVRALRAVLSAYEVTTEGIDNYGHPLKFIQPADKVKTEELAPALAAPVNGGNKRLYCKNHPETAMVLKSVHPMAAVETTEVYKCPEKGCTHTRQEKRVEYITDMVQEDGTHQLYTIDSTTGETLPIHHKPKQLAAPRVLVAPARKKLDPKLVELAKRNGDYDFTSETAINATLAEKFGARWYNLPGDERNDAIKELMYPKDTHEMILARLSDRLRGELPSNHQTGDILVPPISHQSGDRSNEAELQIGAQPLNFGDKSIPPLAAIKPRRSSDDLSLSDIDATIDALAARHGTDRASILYALDEYPPAYSDRYEARRAARSEVRSW